MEFVFIICVINFGANIVSVNNENRISLRLMTVLLQVSARSNKVRQNCHLEINFTIMEF
jgi:hypothetical protein